MTNSTFRKSLTALAVAGGLATPALAVAQDSNTVEAQGNIEKIQVTGSRIKRSDLESASPVEVLSADQLTDQGRLSVADALRNLTSNSFGSFVPSSGSSAQSQSTVNLLGVGASRTLVLLDGKRVAGSPSLGGSSANLSTIPMAAVERIEVLKDGASAVYGSDAVAGVVNIILKDDFEGVAINTKVGRPEAEGGDNESFSITAGTSSDRGNLTMVFEHQTRDAIYDRDRPYTAPQMFDENGDGVISLNDETIGISKYGATLVNPEGNYEASPLCGQLTEDVDGFVGVLDQGTANGGIGQGTVCGYAYSSVSTNMASTDRNSLMVNGNYQINDDVELYMRGMFAKNSSFGRYAPAAAKWENIPANASHNPYDETLDTGYFRWYPAGNRDGYVDDYQQDYVVGFRGFALDNIDWEVYYQRAEMDYKTVGRDYLSKSALNWLAAEGRDPFAPENSGKLGITTLTEGKTIFDHYYAGMGFNIGELPGGQIAHYFGWEMYEQVFENKYDAQSEAGLVGGGAGNSASEDRTVRAYFYEVAMPFTYDLTVSAAFRYDDYSDFGSASTSSLKAEYRPMDALLLRASYSEGFRAPSLEELSAQDQYSSTYAYDYVACQSSGVDLTECPEIQVDNQIQSNNNLGPEESEYINAGIVYSGLDNWDFRLDYFDLKVENVISDVTVQDLINIELGGNLDSFLAANPAFDLQRRDNGTIAGDVYTRTENGSILARRGFDMEIAAEYPLGAGLFNATFGTTYMMDVEEDVYFGGPSQDMSGSSGAPELRSQLMLQYAINDFNVTWTTDYIDSTGETDVLDTSCGDSNCFKYNFAGELESTTYHNVTFSYNFGQYGKATLGVRNVFDEDPVLNSSGQYTNPELYVRGHIGREFVAGYQIQF